MRKREGDTDTERKIVTACNKSKKLIIYAGIQTKSKSHTQATG